MPNEGPNLGLPNAAHQRPSHGVGALARMGLTLVAAMPPPLQLPWTGLAGPMARLIVFPTSFWGLS